MLNKIRYYIVVIATFIIGGLFVFVPLTVSDDRKTPKVLVIGLDGVEVGAFKTLSPPQLTRLMDDGAYTYSSKIYSEHYKGNESSSGPGWSSILTGVWPDKHGINDNAMKDHRLGSYPPLFKTLHSYNPSLKLMSFITWQPIQAEILSNVGLDINTSLEEPPYRTLKGWAKFMEYDEQAVSLATNLLTNANPDVLFIHLAQLDAAGHESGFGPNSPNYLSAMLSLDSLVGRLHEAVVTRSSYDAEDWIIIVCSDHGGKDHSHGGGSGVNEIEETILIVSGNSAQRGEITQPVYIVDAFVTAMLHMGVKDLSSFNLDGKPVGLK
jgi:predicted AlkP superfamily pyrophosphatase or phosphodiesterase